LDGLEVVEVKLSSLERTFRLDSEFYKKEYITIEKKIKGLAHIPLTNIVNIADGNHMKISDNFRKKGIPYYRGQDVSSFFIEQSNPICITQTAYDTPVMKRSYLKKNDILLSIVGTIGKLSLVKEDNKATCSCKLAILRPKVSNSNFLSLFLQSKYGQSQIKRLTRGAVQQGLLLEDMNQIVLPTFSDSLKKIINIQIEIGFEKLKDSKTLYKKAENLLLEELNLLDFKPTKENISIKSFSESFGSSGRLDSEYYLPKYDEVIKRVKLKKFDRLKNIVNIKKSIETGSEAYSDNGVEYIRVSNLTKFGLSQSSIYIPYDFFNKEQLKELKPKKDTILLSKDGTVGIAYSIKNETNIITSGAILHLNIKDNIVLPEYLTLILNSRIVQMQSQRDAGGSIIKHWKPSEIKEILIPIIDYTLQTQIESKIKESFRLKEESKRLLELAKRSVEVAIEEGEDRAMRLIKERGL
jgi:restriction endonuclease S subunit